MYFHIFLLIAVLAIVHCVCSEDINISGDCEEEGVKGKCMDIGVCPSALQQLKLRIKPKICSFNGTSVIPNVCCLDAVTNVDTSRPSPATPEDAECPPLEERYKPKPKQIQQGHKAWAKCVEYQNTALFPCSERGRYSRCNTRYNLNEFGAADDDLTGGGGKSQVVKEFPHMALLGYGDNIDSALWLCGGSLISDKFLLTAAQCAASTFSLIAGAKPRIYNVTYAALGSPTRSEVRSSRDIYEIKSIIVHPQHQITTIYHDIALLETEKRVQFNKRVVPACLHVGDEVPDGIASASGWGATHFTSKKPTDMMQYVPLWKTPDANCSRHYPAAQPYAYDSNTTMCYGDDGFYVRDTCHGDGGGPLQVVSRDINCMYLILGVTSYGIGCATLGVPSVYTRVSAFVSWIESVVWP